MTIVLIELDGPTVVPVIVTLYTLGVDELNPTVEVGVGEVFVFKVTVEGVKVTVRPGTFSVSERVTVSFIPELTRVAVSELVDPELKVTEDGDKPMVKETTVTVTIAEWVSAPLVPVIVTV